VVRPDEIARELAALRERMNRLFDETAANERGGPAWVPTADVYLSGGRIVLTLELPGVDESSIEVTSSGRALRVRGRRAAGPPGEVGALQLERSYGAFARAFQLPQGSRTSEREVTYENGVLRIEIPIG